MSIATPQAVTWSNEHCRPISNLVMQLKAALIEMDATWTAQNITQYFPEGGGDIEDGAQEDGRPINDRDTVITMSGNIQTLISAIDAVDGSFGKISNRPQVG